MHEVTVRESATDEHLHNEPTSGRCAFSNSKLMFSGGLRLAISYSAPAGIDKLEPKVVEPAMLFSLFPSHVAVV